MDSIADIAWEDVSLDLGRKGEDSGTARVVLGREGEVELGNSLENGASGRVLSGYRLM